MATDSDRILGAGKPVTFLDGSIHTLRFDFRALKVLEDDFGSVTAVYEALSNNAMFSTAARVMYAALGREFDSLDEMLDQLDVNRIREYTKASIDALTEGLPQVEADPTRQARPKRRTTASPGPTSTTPLPFGLVAATPTSGG